MTGLGALRQQVQLDRAVGNVAQSQTHNLAKERSRLFQFLDVDRRIDLNIAERAEVFDRQVELFLEKLGGIGHHRSATAEKHPLRSRSTLLGAVELNRLIDLHVQASQDVSGHLGNGSHLRIIRFLVSATQTDKALSNLEFLGLGEGHLGLG